MCRYSATTNVTFYMASERN